MLSERLQTTLRKVYRFFFHVTPRKFQVLFVDTPGKSDTFRLPLSKSDSYPVAVTWKIHGKLYYPRKFSFGTISEKTQIGGGG